MRGHQSTEDKSMVPGPVGCIRGGRVKSDGWVKSVGCRIGRVKYPPILYASPDRMLVTLVKC